jgi:uncharacterized membrane protein YqgA involved in biofilm formation
MLGTTVNAIAIVLGSLIGLLLRRGLAEKYKTAVGQGLGFCVIFVGASGAIKNMISPGANPVLFIICIAIGSFLGEKLRIEEKLEAFGQRLEQRVSRGETGLFAKGFVSASLLFCVGSMGILGSIESGIQGVHSTLFAKSVIDGISALIFASTFGIGVLFSAFSVFLYQGAITLAASLIAPFITDAMLLEIGIVGGIMITAIGFNMLGVLKVKVGNMLPAVLGPVIYYLILNLLNRIGLT